MPTDLGCRGRIAAFRDDSFEAESSDLRLDSLGRARQRFRQHQRKRRVATRERRRIRRASSVWRISESVADRQRIERDVDECQPLRRSVLQRLEERSSRGVERHDLAVEHE
jgi:hypothetical protein